MTEIRTYKPYKGTNRFLKWLHKPVDDIDSADYNFTNHSECRVKLKGDVYSLGIGQSIGVKFNGMLITSTIASVYKNDKLFIEDGCSPDKWDLYIVKGCPFKDFSDLINRLRRQ